MLSRGLCRGTIRSLASLCVAAVLVAGERAPSRPGPAVTLGGMQMPPTASALAMPAQMPLASSTLAGFVLAAAERKSDRLSLSRHGGGSDAALSRPRRRRHTQYPTNSTHAKVGRPVARVCEHEDCELGATFGDPAGGGPVRCRLHRAPAHRLVRGWTPCLHAEGCAQRGVYGSRFGRPLYCHAHKSSAHVSLSFRGRKCRFSGCVKQPSFGSLVDARVRFCRQHKLAGDVDLRSLRCRHPEGCLKGATFAPPGCKVPRRCAAHRMPQDERVIQLKNSSAMAQVSVCSRCLQKISRRNMAKHFGSSACQARSALPYVRHKRSRMGRDVTDALNGRMGRRHPTLSVTPALYPEAFISSGALTALPRGVGPPAAKAARARARLSTNRTMAASAPQMPHNDSAARPSSDHACAASRKLSGVVVLDVAQPGRGNESSPGHRYEGGVLLRRRGAACTRCIRNKRSTAYCSAHNHAPPPPCARSRSRQARCASCVANKRSTAYCEAMQHEPEPQHRAAAARPSAADTPRRSVYVGVGWNKQKLKWRGRVGNMHVGFFDDEHEAAQAVQRYLAGEAPPKTRPERLARRATG